MWEYENCFSALRAKGTSESWTAFCSVYKIHIELTGMVMSLISISVVMLAFHGFHVRVVLARAASSLSMETADLCDAYGDLLQYVEPIFRDFGQKTKFGGKISTVKCHEDNSYVKAALSEQGNGRVLVVDGGGSMRRALLGDNVAASALKNNWNGIIIYGCVRDTSQLEKIDVGIKALGAIPRKTEKKNAGSRDVPVTFGGVTFRPDEYVYADRDGIVVSDQRLTLEGKL